VATGGASAAFSRAYNEARNKQAEKENTAVTVVERNNAATNPTVLRNSRPASEPLKQPAKEPELSKVVWNSATNAVRIGDIEVEIKRLRVASIALQDMFGKQVESKNELLAITVAVTSFSAGKKLDYRTWRGARFGLEDSVSKLTDDNGNDYKRINFSSGTTVMGAVETESIYPGEGLTDVIVFEKPVDAAKWLHLALPAENIKNDGTIRFEIPDTMIEKWGQSNDSRGRVP
jgi:hypothetical protein